MSIISWTSPSPSCFILSVIFTNFPVLLFKCSVFNTFGIDNPTVGVLSVGEEESKGNEVTLAAAELIKKTKLNFVGNVEGRDILKGTANVIVCDGFVGNILIKFGESVVPFLRFKFKQFAEKSIFNKLKVGLVRNTLREILKDFDYQEHGGVPLLGVNGISIIGHGSSTTKAFKNMVLKANELIKKRAEVA